MQAFGGSKQTFTGMTLGSLNGVDVSDAIEGSILTFQGGKWVASSSEANQEAKPAKEEEVKSEAVKEEAKPAEEADKTVKEEAKSDVKPDVK